MLIGDSAYPLATYPTSWNGQPIVGWGFYIGGNTPHVWTLAEVEKLKQTYKYLLPIYTRSNPQQVEAQSDLTIALQRLSYYGVPKDVLVQWDYETAVDSSYEEAVNSGLLSSGYLMELYGSSSTVVQNKIPSGGYDEANWIGKDSAPDSTAVQFIDVGSYDLNDFRSDAKLWMVQETVITTFPPVHESDEEDSMAQAMGGWCDLSWSSGSKHVVQVSYDGVGGNAPSLRVVLHLPSGPVVLRGDNKDPWEPTSADHALEFPTEHVKDAYGITLEAYGASKPARYGAFVA